jgi:serine phosphatase RsbU (regulator of sigma subunit)
MNLLGRRSLSSFFKVLLDIAFYAACLAAAVSVVATVAASRAKTTSNASLNLPVRFEIDPSVYQIHGAGGAAVDASIDEASGNVTVKNPPVASIVLTMLGVIAVEAVLLVVLYRVRRLFRRLVEGRPFLDENARTLRFIGFAVMAGELAWAALQYLGQRAVAATLSSAEISFHAAFAPRLPVILAGLALLIVAEIFREGIKMRADLETARTIQTSLVAAEASRHGPVSIHARMQPAAEVGGDYYDVIDLGDGQLAFVVADVAGKGLPAALLMTLLRGSLRSLLAAGLRGTALMNALNTHLVANTPGNRMVTCFYAEIDPATGRLIYVNAGHNPPYLYDGAERRTLDPTAIVLGMIDGMPFPEAAVELRAGSRLLLYTDGITEAENRAGDQFGVERLEDAIGGSGHSEPGGVLDAIIATVVRFRGTARQSDDMTMMLVSREGASYSGAHLST